MLSNKSSKIITVSIISLAVVSLIGLIYAAFTGQLFVNSGDVVSRTSSWDIHFENVSNLNPTGSAKVLNNHHPKVNENNPTEIDDYEASLTSPGDTISFTFDVVNGGNYNAKITSISVGSPKCDVNGDETDISAVNMCKNLTYSLTYSSGATVQTNDMLYAKDKLTLKVTLTFNDISDPNLLPKSDVSISDLGITINFEQVGSAEVGDNGVVQNNKVYHIGDKVTLNNEDYWVIENSGAGQDYVVALKDEPLTVDEVNTYGGVGTENNHVNKYTNVSVGTAYNKNTYGGVAYYSSETCGYVNNSWNFSDCKLTYDESDVKYIINNWISGHFLNDKLKESNNYKGRLITLDEFTLLKNDYSFIHSNGYAYWTMTSNNSSSAQHYWYYVNGKNVYSYYPTFYDNVRSPYAVTIRPVINIYKSALETQ